MEARVGGGREDGDDVEGRRMTDASSRSCVPGLGHEGTFEMPLLKTLERLLCVRICRRGDAKPNGAHRVRCKTFNQVRRSSFALP